MKVKLKTTRQQIEDQTANAVSALANCYQSKNMTFDKLANIAIVNGHESVLEYFDLVFQIDGISFGSHVHVIRHRHGTPLVQSQRYTASNDFIVPEVVCKDAAELIDKQAEIIKEIASAAKDATNQDIRYVKPQGTRINMAFKCNLRQFLHIVALRDSSAAMPETRECVKQMISEACRHPGLAKIINLYQEKLDVINMALKKWRAERGNK